MRGRKFIESLEARRYLSVTLLKDVVAGTGRSYPVNFTQLNSSQVVFAALDGSGSSGTSGEQLWQTDGTPVNTSRVMTFNGGLDLHGTTAVLNGSSAYFFANDGTHGFELWKSQGTSQTTSLVDDIDPGPSSSGYYGDGSFSYPDPTRIGSQIFFQANDGTNGYALWKTDGTTAGTKMIKTLPFDGFHSVKFVDLNGVAYFRIYGAGETSSLWRSDGTSVGTVMVKATNYLVSLTLPPDDFNVAGSYCYFSVFDGMVYRLWETDGTTTQPVPGAASLSNPYGFINVHGVLYFGATNGGKTGLWTTDGTKVTLLTDAVTPTSDANIDIRSVNTNWASDARDFVIFFAKNAFGNCSIWRTDGTPGGTSKVIDTSGSYGPTISFNGYVYIGAGLYRSDGTATGTVVLKDSNNNSLSGGQFSVINNMLFFSGVTISQGTEPWRLTDDVVPLIYKSQLNFNQPNHSIQFKFDENLSSAPSLSNITVQKSDGSSIATSAMNLSFDSSTSIATLSFPGLPNRRLPEGQYTVTVSAAGVKDVAGNLMSASYAASVGFLLADANADGTVNSSDFSALAANFGKTSGMTFSSGDFNYDGIVNALDFNALATRYGKTLATSSDTPAESMASLSGARPVSLFASQPIAGNILLDPAGDPLGVLN